MKQRIRMMRVSLLVDADNLGSVIADLVGRAEVESIGVVEAVPYNKNKPRAKLAPKPKNKPAKPKPWTPKGKPKKKAYKNPSEVADVLVAGVRRNPDGITNADLKAEFASLGGDPARYGVLVSTLTRKYGVRKNGEGAKAWFTAPVVS